MFSPTTIEREIKGVKAQEEMVLRVEWAEEESRSTWSVGHRQKRVTWDSFLVCV